MANFDITDYLNQQFEENNQKLQAVHEASQRKVQELQQKLSTLKEPAKPTWAEQLGLDRFGAGASVVNAAGSLAAGASRLAGHIASVPQGIAFTGGLSNIPADIQAAYARSKQGQSSPADEGMLNVRGEDGLTMKERMDGLVQQSQDIQSINKTFDISHVRDDFRQGQLTESLGAAYNQNVGKIKSDNMADKVSGIAGLLYDSAGALLNNKEGVLNFVQENLPQIGVGAIPGVGGVLMGASNVGYAVDTLHQGVAEYAKKNDGALPPPEKLREMTNMAATLAMAEQAGDMVTLGAGKLPSRPAKQLADDVAKSTERTSFKEALKNTGKATGEAAATEMPTEAYQTWVEGEITGKPASGVDIWSGAVIGGASGGMIGGTARGLHEGAKLASQKPELTPEQQRAEDNKALVKQATETGDVSGLTDPKQKNYAPDQAIAGLFGHAQKNPEKAAENLTKANEIMSDLQNQRDELTTNLRTPEQIKADIATYEAQLASPNTSETQKESIQMLLGMEQASLEDAVNKPLDDKAKAGLERQVSRLNKLIEQAQESYTHLENLSKPKQDLNATLESLVAQIEAPADNQTPEAAKAKISAADQFIVMAMANPDRVNQETLDLLSSNTALSEGQRSALRAFSEARIKANELRNTAGVAKEIYEGSTDNVGIRQYLSRTSDALASGSKQAAERQLTGLAKFLESHRGKAVAAAQAVAEGLGSIRKEGNSWIAVKERFPDEKSRKKNGGLNIGPNSSNLVSNIQLEADAIATAHNAVQSMIAARFNQPIKTNKPNQVNPVKSENEVTNVSNLAQQKAREAANPATEGQQSTQATGVATQSKGSSGESGAAGVPDGKVEARQSDDVVTQNQPESTQTNDAAPAAVVGTEKKLTQTQESKESSTPLQKNSDTQENPDSVEAADAATQVDETPEVGPKEGQLSVFNTLTNTEENVPYQKQNLVTRYLKQVLGKDTDTTHRPLVAVKDFLSNINGALVSEFTGLNDFTDAQKNVLNTFKSFAKDLDAELLSNLFVNDSVSKETGKHSSEYYYKNLLQYFIQKDGKKLTIDENMRTALSYAAFSWINETTGRSEYNDKDSINEMLGRSDLHEVTALEENLLGGAGQRINTVSSSLGAKAAQALGLKPTKDAPSNLQPVLEAVLGRFVLQAMINEGLVDLHVVTAAEMAQIDKRTADNKADHLFIRSLKDPKAPKRAYVQNIKDASKGTRNILDKLFGVESAVKEPSFEPIPYKQSRIKNTMAKVPKTLASIIEKEIAVPNYIEPVMYGLVNVMSDSNVLEMAGAKHTTDDATGELLVHISQADGLAAKAEGLARELEAFKSFVSGMQDHSAPFFLDHVVWKVQRVGISGIINPQTSKIHRHLITRNKWKTEVNLNQKASVENFNLRAAEGLGIKTDKTSKAQALKAFAEKSTTPVIQAGVAAAKLYLQNGNMDTMPEAAQKDLVAAVKEGGENMHSLHAIVALAQHDLAKQNGQTSFTTHLIGEVDGVTNGPMLMHLLLGAAHTWQDLFGTLNRGGFFEKGSQYSQYNHYRSDAAAGNLDIYEKTMKGILAQVKNPKLKINEKTLSAVYAFTGNLGDAATSTVTKDGRNMIKQPLTAMVFGASLSKAVDSMSSNFVESIYSFIAKQAVNAQQGEAFESAASIIKYINDLIVGGAIKNEETDEWIRAAPVSNMTVKQLMTYEFTPSQREAIQLAFARTLGKAVKASMEQDFDLFMQKRTVINATAQASFELYNAVYQAEKSQELERLMDLYIQDSTQGIPFTQGKDGRIPIRDFTNQEKATFEKKLENVIPMMRTQFSKDSGSLLSGLEGNKSRRGISRVSSYISDMKFGKRSNDVRLGHTTRVAAMETVLENPGVSMAIMSAHSSDSHIMHNSLGDTEALNIHDAKGVGVGGFQEAAKTLNESLWNTMLNYSPMAEAQRTFERTVKGINWLLNQPSTSPETALAVHKALELLVAKYNKSHRKAEATTDTVLSLIEQDIAIEARLADQVKFEAMANMAYVDQYALEGGHYQVTDQDRAEAQKRADVLKEVAPKTGLANTLLETMNGIEIPEQSRTQPEVEQAPVEDVDPIVEQAQPEKTPQQGNPVVQPNAMLQRFFEQNPNTDAARMIKGIAWALNNDPTATNKEFMLKILKLASKLVAGDLKVIYVTKDTMPENVVARPEGDVRGWTAVSADGRQGEIYILSPEFSNSALTPELLLHELVHAALARAVRSKAAAAQPYIKNLEEILSKAKKFVQANNLTQFNEAVSNIDELLAYGLTNQEFQQQVLAKFNVPAPGINKVVKAMQAFVISAARLLGFKSQEDANALGSLIANASNLAYLAAKNKPTQAIKQTGKKNEQSEYDTMAMAQNERIDAIDQFTTTELFDALDNGQGSPVFAGHLRGLLEGIVEKLHGPFGVLHQAARKTEAGNPLAVWLKAIETGNAPFTSELVNSPLTSTAQQDFVAEHVEATVRAALESNESQTKMAYRELAKLYQEAYNKLVPADFDADPAVGQAKYDFIFKMEGGADKRSNYLARFAALGLANQEFNNLLRFETARDQRTVSGAKTLLEKLSVVFDKILQFFAGKASHTYEGQQGDLKLNALVDTLVDIEAKRRHRLSAEARDNFTEKIDRKGKEFADLVKSTVENLANSKLLANSKYKTVQFGAAMVRTVAGNRTDAFMDALADYRDTLFNERNGFLMSLINELKHPENGLKRMILLTKKNEQDRKSIITHTAKFVMESFADKGENLSDATKGALTHVFLRSGAHVLLDYFDMAQLEQLVSDPDVLTRYVQQYENRLTGPYRGWYVQQAKNLAYYKMHGKVKSQMLMMNANNIVQMYGLNVSDLVDVDANTAAVNTLVSLYALQYASEIRRNQAKEVLRTENRRVDGNGVEFMLKLHKQLENESKERLFDGNDALMVHGYTPEIYNPYTDIAVVNAKEGAELVNQGYTRIGNTMLDPHDPIAEPKYMYVLKNGGMTGYLSGAVSLTGMKAKGSNMHSGYLNPYSQTGLDNGSANTEVLNSRNVNLRMSLAEAKRFSPDNVGSNFMAPLLNDQGTVVNWRYMMQENTKDTVLERDSRMENILGSLAGSIYDKPVAREQNKEIFKALHEQYTEEYATNSHRYITIAHDATDPELKQIWDMLPKHTKDDIKAIWGENRITVRKDALDILFGYRKLSAANMFKRAYEERAAADKRLGDVKAIQNLESINAIQKMLVYSIEAALIMKDRANGYTQEEAEKRAARAAVVIGRLEKGWQEIIREIKDMIVVKNGVTLMGNIWSNLSLLALKGVPLTDIVKHHNTAIKAAIAFKADSAALDRAKTFLATGYTQGNEATLQREIVRLEDAIARNPVKKLIDAGLMPTIVDDVAMEEDPFSYKSALTKKVNNLLDKTHPMVKTALRTAYMTHDTPLYQALSRTTQLSDFVARYTLYQHLITRKNDPLSEQDAIIEAADPFIIYDLPMHRKLQYSDDMGLTMFTKYTLRIQRELVKIFRENPARVLSTALMGQYMDLGPIVLEGHLFNKLGHNPFQMGAFKYPEALEELVTMKGAMDLVR